MNKGTQCSEGVWNASCFFFLFSVLLLSHDSDCNFWQWETAGAKVLQEEKTFLDCGVMSDINLGNSQSLYLKYSLFFWYSHCIYATPLIVIPQSLDSGFLWVFFFSSFCSICFLVFKDSIDYIL